MGVSAGKVSGTIPFGPAIEMRPISADSDASGGFADEFDRFLRVSVHKE